MRKSGRGFQASKIYSKRIGLRLTLICMAILFALSATGCNELEDVLNLLERLIDRFEQTEDAVASPVDQEAVEPSGNELEPRLMLTLYFADNQAADDMVAGQYGFVTPVKRVIPNSDDPLTAAINELISGPLPEDGNVGMTVPDTAMLLSASVSGSTAVLNFNDKFASDHPGGVLSTQVTVESLVYTATEFSGLESVRVLVEGAPWADGYGFVWSSPIGRAGISDALRSGEETIETEAPPDNMAVYVNADYGFALKHPGDWSVFEYEWVDLQTREIKSESIFIAPGGMIELIEDMVQEDGSIPASPSGVPVVVNRYPQLKVPEAADYLSVTSESITVGGRTGTLYTCTHLISVPGFDAGSIIYDAVFPTDYGSLSFILQVEQYEDVFRQILASLNFI